MLSHVSRVPSNSNANGVSAQKTSNLMADPFVFVPIPRSEAAKGRGAAKRVVRAHVTRVQHAKSSTPSAHMELQLWTVMPHTHREASETRKNRPGGHSKNSAQSSSGSSQQSDRSSPASNSSSSSFEVFLPKLPAGNAAEDPFWTFPVDYQPQLSPIFAHCMSLMSFRKNDF